MLMKPVMTRAVERDTVPDAIWLMAIDVSPSSSYACGVKPGLIYEEQFRLRRLIVSSVRYFERQRLEMSKKSIKFVKTLSGEAENVPVVVEICACSLRVQFDLLCL